MTDAIGIAHYDTDPERTVMQTGIHEGRVVVTVEAHGRGVQLMLPPENASELARQVAENVLLILGPDDSGAKPIGHA